MASSSADVRAPEVSQFSLFDEAVTSFQECGFLYQNIPEIGKLVDSLGPEANTRDGFNKHFKGKVFLHQHLKQVLEPYVQNLPTFTFSLGADPIRYFALTDDQDIGHGQGHPVAIYIWSKSTELEVAVGSQAGEFTAVEWANHMFYVPYPQIEGLFNETRAIMEGGGILITHPRLAFIVRRGLSICSVWGENKVDEQ